MSNYNQNPSNNNLWIVIGSLAFILIILFGLNWILMRNNKNDSEIINKVVNDHTTKGDAKAKVKLVEYADFQCPACAAQVSNLKKLFTEINAEYGSSSLSVTYKYFPLIQIHKNAMLASQSVEAAGLQGKFWEMHDLVFTNQTDWAEALDAKIKLENYATELGMDLDKFKLERDSEVVKNKISDSYKEAVKIGLNHTPTIFLNGVEVKDLGELKNSILEKLNVTTSTPTSNSASVSAAN